MSNINHERFYSSYGFPFRILHQVPRLANGSINYSIQGTDVRWIVFPAGSITVDFKYEVGAKVSHLVQKHNADYGFNFPFFYQGMVLGDNEDADVVISSAYGNTLNRHEFYSIDDKLYIGQANMSPEVHQDFVTQAGPLLISDGDLAYDWFRIQENIPSDIGLSRAQRTWIGLRQNGDLIVAICDGRTSSNIGFTLEEQSLFMMRFDNMDFALNGDGGSSTTLADKTGSLGQNQGAYEAVVHHAVLIYLNPPMKTADYEELARLIELYGIDVINKAISEIKSLGPL